MKQLLFSLLFCACCFGQQSTAPTIVIFAGSPAGKVCSPSQIGLNSSTGATCGCSAGVFASCGGGGSLPSGTGVVRVDSGTGSAAEMSGFGTTSGSNALVPGVVASGQELEIKSGGSLVCDSGSTCPGGGLSGLTTGYIPQATSSTAIGNTNPVLDNGITTANQLTYAGTAGYAGASLTGTGTNLPVNVANPNTGQVTTNTTISPVQQATSNTVTTFVNSGSISSGTDMPNVACQGQNGFPAWAFVDGINTGNVWYCEAQDAYGAVTPNCTQITTGVAAQEPYLVCQAEADSLPRLMYNISNTHVFHFVVGTTTSPTGTQTHMTTNTDNPVYTAGASAYYGVIDMSNPDGFARGLINDPASGKGLEYLKFTTTSGSSGVGVTQILTDAEPTPLQMHLDSGSGGDNLCRIDYDSGANGGTCSNNYIQCLADPPAGGVGVGYNITTGIMTNASHNTCTNPDFVLDSSHFAHILQGTANGTNPQLAPCTNPSCSANSGIITFTEIAKTQPISGGSTYFGDGVAIALGNDGNVSFVDYGAPMWLQYPSYFVHCLTSACPDTTAGRNLGILSPTSLYPLGLYFNTSGADHNPKVVAAVPQQNNLQIINFSRPDFFTTNNGAPQQQMQQIIGNLGTPQSPALIYASRIFLTEPPGWPNASGAPTTYQRFNSSVTANHSGGYALCGTPDIPSLGGFNTNNSLSVDNLTCSAKPILVDSNSPDGELRLRSSQGVLIGNVTLSGPNGNVSWNSSGQVTEFAGKAASSTSSDGQPYDVGNASGAAFSTTQGPTNLLAAPVNNHMYRVSYVIWQSASGSGGTCLTNATVTPSFTWTDPASQAQTFTGSAVSLTPTLTTGAFVQNDLRIVAKSGTAITYTWTFANGNCSTQPTATAQALAEAIN